MESYWQLVDVMKIKNLHLPFTSTTQQLTPGISSATCQLLDIWVLLQSSQTMSWWSSVGQMILDSGLVQLKLLDLACLNHFCIHYSLSSHRSIHFRLFTCIHILDYNYMYDYVQNDGKFSRGFNFRAQGNFQHFSDSIFMDAWYNQWHVVMCMYKDPCLIFKGTVFTDFGPTVKTKILWSLPRSRDGCDIEISVCRLLPNWKSRFSWLLPV